MKNKLDLIIDQKQREVIELYQHIADNPTHPIADLLQGGFETSFRSHFKSMLKAKPLSVIAEIKRQSPSKGLISTIPDPANLAQAYISGGASCLSVLTDYHFFGGTLKDLIEVVKVADQQSIPVLRKDFIIDKIQIAEARLSGASAVLCIISVLGNKAKHLIDYAKSIGLDVLVEVHDATEIKIALDCGADIIGINNRNLNTFDVRTESSLTLLAQLPNTVIKVAESGITEPMLAQQYYQAGFDAVLIGEALVKSVNPAQFIEACRYG